LFVIAISPLPPDAFHDKVPKELDPHCKIPPALIVPEESVPKPS